MEHRSIVGTPRTIARKFSSPCTFGVQIGPQRAKWWPMTTRGVVGADPSAA
jgi:hypothetical protein